MAKATEHRATQIPLPRTAALSRDVGVIGAKFLTDAAWYFYMFWLPKYLLDARGFDIKAVGSVAWIPFAAAGVGCLFGGGLSSWLLHRGHSVNAARKIALGLSAAAHALGHARAARLGAVGASLSSVSRSSATNRGQRW